MIYQPAAFPRRFLIPAARMWQSDFAKLILPRDLDLCEGHSRARSYDGPALSLGLSIYLKPGIFIYLIIVRYLPHYDIKWYWI